MWMNEYDIQRAVAQFAQDPVLGPAARYLDAFKDEVNRHSDGWPYWRAASNAANKLTTLLHGHMWAGMGAYPILPAATMKDVQRSLTPIKSFMTRRGLAAGMQMPVLWTFMKAPEK
jgi:hypothetical protein